MGGEGAAGNHHACSASSQLPAGHNTAFAPISRKINTAVTRYSEYCTEKACGSNALLYPMLVQHTAATSLTYECAERNTEPTQATFGSRQKKHTPQHVAILLPCLRRPQTGRRGGGKEGRSNTRRTWSADDERTTYSSFTSPSDSPSCSKYSSIEEALGSHPSVLRVTVESYTLAGPVTANSFGVSSPQNLGIFFRL